MTLQAFFDLLEKNPIPVLSFFLLVPLTAVLAGWLGRGEGHLTPWKYLYTTLVYLICIPGICAISLSFYLFLFENRSILSTNIYTQILPVLSMIATLLLIRNNVSLDRVPGFEKISGLFLMIFAVLFLMWILDRTRIFVVAFTAMPFYYVLLIFVGLFLMLRLGMNRLFKNANHN